MRVELAARASCADSLSRRRQVRSPAIQMLDCAWHIGIHEYTHPIMQTRPHTYTLREIILRVRSDSSGRTQPEVKWVSTVESRSPMPWLMAHNS